MAVIISPGSIACSLSGVAPGSRKKSSTETWRSPRWTDRVEGDQRDGEIAGIHGDAGVAGAEHGMAAGDAADRRAAAAGRALVAGGEVRGIAEIGAARALHQIAADGRHVADLRRSRLPQRFRDGGEAALDVGMVGDMAHLRQRADGGAALARRRSASSPLRWVMSTSVSGSATPHLARSISVVPPAKQHGAGQRGRLACGIDRVWRAGRKNPS